MLGADAGCCGGWIEDRELQAGVEPVSNAVCADDACAGWREYVQGGICAAGWWYRVFGVSQHEAVTPGQDTLDSEPAQRGLQLRQERHPVGCLGHCENRGPGF